LTNRVHEAETLNLEQMEAFLEASEAMRFEGETRQQVYPWMERVLCRQRYHQQGRAARGLVRQQPRYRERRLCYLKTRPTTVAIGERRRPDPQGRPGFLRIDTVHQGDAPGGSKGLYHINAVDEVTQWQIVAATPHIGEAWLEPLLQAIIRQFPFRILGFHSDNGSEYINAVIARLLNKLLIQQTKSRPRHSNDNGYQTSHLLQLGVLGFGLLEDGDVGVGIFPEGEEVFVGREGADAGGVGIGGGDMGCLNMG
jgi:hypothetical protein